MTLGCPGIGSAMPNLCRANNTTGGATVTFSIANAPTTVPAAYALGVGRTALVLPNGCTLLTNPVVMVPVGLDANGRFLLSLNVPAGVIGMVNVQAAVVDLGALGSFTLSNGVELTAN